MTMDAPKDLTDGIESLNDKQVAEWTYLVLKDKFGWRQVDLARALGYEYEQTISALLSNRPRATKTFGIGPTRTERRMRCIQLLEIAESGRFLGPLMEIIPTGKGLTLENCLSIRAAKIGKTPSEKAVVEAITPFVPEEGKATGGDLLTVLDQTCESLKKMRERIEKRAEKAPKLLRPGLQEAVTKLNDLIALLDIAAP